MAERARPRKRQPASSPYFTEPAPENSAPKRLRPELLQPAPSPPPAPAAAELTPLRRRNPTRRARSESEVTEEAFAREPDPSKSSNPTQEDDDDLVTIRPRKPSSNPVTSEPEGLPVDAPESPDLPLQDREPFFLTPPPVARARCALAEAIRQRESNPWRTTSIIDASAPLLTHLRLRAELKPLIHKVYNAAFTRPDDGLIAAAGGEGRISVFPTLSLTSYNGRNAPLYPIQPLVSFVGHTNWVSAVQFLQEYEAPKLLSSSNAGDVSLWQLDPTIVHGETKLNNKLLFTHTAHSDGIWSLHELNARVVTASKDARVKLWALLESGISLVHTYDDLHEKTVKCARWRDSVTFASCGNDRIIQVVDTRTSRASLTLPGMHTIAINTLAWRPFHEHFLLSNKPKINIYDLRFPFKPLFQLRGHTEKEKMTSITHPIWFYHGSMVAAPSEQSPKISLWSAQTGLMVARPSMGVQCQVTQTPSPTSATLATVMASRIYITELAMTKLQK